MCPNLAHFVVANNGKDACVLSDCPKVAMYLFPNLAYSGVARNGKSVCSVIAKSGNVSVSKSGTFWSSNGKGVCSVIAKSSNVHSEVTMPFQIFKTRFTRPPENIVYDNSCRLHLYSLNREPVFFQATRFFVDRFHWRGHVGCNSGYCLDKYPSQNIAQIN